jgi:hypothetical protein
VNSDIGNTGDFIEAQAVIVITGELRKIEHLHRFKLSKALAFSSFIFNVIRARLDEENPPSLVTALDAQIPNKKISEYFQDFDKRDQCAVSYSDLIYWLRNRLIHFEGTSAGKPEKFKRGVTVESRGRYNGIRGFWVHGTVRRPSKGQWTRTFTGYTDRRRLQGLIDDVTKIYIQEIGYAQAWSKIEQSEKDEVSRIEREA